MWQKNGKKFENPLLLGGMKIYNPTEAQLREAGYSFIIDPIPEPALKKEFTKRQIRFACRALGVEEKLDALLEGNATFARDWSEAQDIDFTNAELIAAVEAAGITGDELEKLLNHLRETPPRTEA